MAFEPRIVDDVVPEGEYFIRNLQFQVIGEFKSHSVEKKKKKLTNNNI